MEPRLKGNKIFLAITKQFYFISDVTPC